MVLPCRDLLFDLWTSVTGLVVKDGFNRATKIDSSIQLQFAYYRNTTYRLKIKNYKLQITNYKNTTYKLKIENYKLQIEGYKLKITD